MSKQHHNVSIIPLRKFVWTLKFFCVFFLQPPPSGMTSSPTLVSPTNTLPMSDVPGCLPPLLGSPLPTLTGVSVYLRLALTYSTARIDLSAHTYPPLRARARFALFAPLSLLSWSRWTLEKCHPFAFPRKVGVWRAKRRHAACSGAHDARMMDSGRKRHRTWRRSWFGIHVRALGRLGRIVIRCIGAAKRTAKDP